MSNKGRAAETSESRRKRAPFGVPKKKLNLDDATMQRLKDDGLVPRWVNDVGSRIHEALAGDYNFVNNPNVKVGDTEESVDARIRKQVGTQKTGEPLYAYLMAIKKEFYDEDQEAKEEINKKVDHAIRGGNPTGLKHHGINPELGGSTVKNIDYQP